MEVKREKKEAQTELAALKAARKQKSTAFTQAKKEEAKVRKERGDKERVSFNAIEKCVLKPRNIHVSSCHGKEFEGPEMKKLMEQGREVFKEIEDFLCE